MSEQNQQSDSSTSIFNRTLKILAIPVSLATGFWTMKTNTSDAVYQRLKIDGGIDDLRNPLLEKRKDLTQTLVSQLSTHEDPSALAQFHKESKLIDAAYFKKIEGRLEELGMESFPAQWKFIHRSHRQSAIINGLTISGIAIGALLSIANSKALARAFSLGDDDQHEPPQR